MKKKLLYFVLLFVTTFYAQTQIGVDIDGEAEYDRSGRCINLSSDGSIVAIGASMNDGNGSNSGHVRIFKNISNVWTQIGTDIDGQSGESFGFSLSLSSDGNIVAIGARNSGYVRIYQNISNVWTQIGVDIDNEFGEDSLGECISLSSDGTVVAIDGIGSTSGHVRVFKNISNVWTQIGANINSEGSAKDIGQSVSLSSDGSVVAIGASTNDANGSLSGHVRIYQNISDVWTQISTDIDGETAYDYSGSSVSLSSNGSIVAIGAYGSDGNGSNSGQVRVFENISDVWTQIGADIYGEIAGDKSGSSISLSSDGNIIAIGAPFNGENGTDSGHVRVFENISGNWTQIGIDIDGEASGDTSGICVSLSNDGSTVAVGAIQNSNDNGIYSGHVRVYDLSALLDLEDNFISQNITIYPNPVKEKIQLKLSNILELKKVIIYNTFGQQILQSTTSIIDVSSLLTGIYYIEITTNEGKGVKKIIIE